jgi:hypothetical protein
VLGLIYHLNEGRFVLSIRFLPVKDDWTFRAAMSGENEQVGWFFKNLIFELRIIGPLYSLL